ncbi:MAG: NAD(P)-dependent oxidoreductase [Candidatus Dormibacteraeota bacterium]|nr:NAD(P)-dependent oxidoreductase [Candidatus Dormibacteraeota bacterium]
MDSIPQRVSVVGLGLLGSAMARAYVAAGFDVTVWNRSPAATKPFSGSAHVARSVAEALCASDVTIVCLINPAACRMALRSAETERALKDKVLIQLTTTTPSDARDEASWVEGCGAAYLGGAILVSPALMGSDRAKAFYCGKQAVFDKYRSWLQVLAPNSMYLGEEFGLSATMDHALLELSYGCQAMLFHAMALCEAGSLPLRDFLAQVSLFADGFVEQRAGAIGSGSYPSGTASMHTFESWARQLVRTSSGAGVDTSIPDTLLAGIIRTIELGHGGDDYQALYEAFRRRDERQLGTAG